MRNGELGCQDSHNLVHFCFLHSVEPLQQKSTIHTVLQLNALNTYWESGGIAPHTLDLSTRWRWVVSFMHQPLYPQNQSGNGGEGKIPGPCWDSNPQSSSLQPSTIPLSYPSSQYTHWQRKINLWNVLMQNFVKWTLIKWGVPFTDFALQSYVLREDS
jgi:hypothetical protein